MAARTNTKYESDEGTIHPISLTANFATAAGTPPAGAVNSSIKAKVTKSNREAGLRPRGVRLFRTLGTAPDTFKRYAFLPVLTAAGLASATFAPGATITIGTVAWTVSTRVQEDY